MRLIDADRLKKYARKVEDKHLGFLHTVDVSDIDNAPTVEERPKGEWLMNNQAIEEWMCSVCHEKFDNIPTCMGEPLYSFCPDCGADLRD